MHVQYQWHVHVYTQFPCYLQHFPFGWFSFMECRFLFHVRRSARAFLGRLWQRTREEVMWPQTWAIKASKICTVGVTETEEIQGDESAFTIWNLIMFHGNCSCLCLSEKLRWYGVCRDLHKAIFLCSWSSVFSRYSHFPHHPSPHWWIASIKMNRYDFSSVIISWAVP